jgi:hypothetical protein
MAAQGVLCHLVSIQRRAHSICARASHGPRGVAGVERDSANLGPFTHPVGAAEHMTHASMSHGPSTSACGQKGAHKASPQRDHQPLRRNAHPSVDFALLATSVQVACTPLVTSGLQATHVTSGIQAGTSGQQALQAGGRLQQARPTQEILLRPRSPALTRGKHLRSWLGVGNAGTLRGGTSMLFFVVCPCTAAAWGLAFFTAKRPGTMTYAPMVH